MRRSKFKKKLLTAILLFNIFFIGAIFISSYHTTNRFKLLAKKRIQNKTVYGALNSSLPQKRLEDIVILFWTKYFQDDPLLTVLDLQAVIKEQPKCFQNCRVVNDPSYLGISDAVIFHSRDMGRDDLPPVHHSSQVWIYFQQESPSYTTTEDLSEYANVFNWTMTYRRDSDVYYPYARVISGKTTTSGTPSGSLVDFSLTKKTKLVLWIVSNCNTKGKRERLVDHLERFIPIDIYGSCGDYPCSRDTPEGCLFSIAPQYKFYLSFENSLCSDYITEKFYKALQYNLVPVVYGGADYDSLAPPHSFIDVNDFDSPKALANYLMQLDKNDEEYLKYFEWKRKYKIVQDGWCELCRKLKNQKLNPEHKIYGNLWKWWLYTEKNKNANNAAIYNSTDLSRENEAVKVFNFPESNYVPACQDDSLPYSSFDIFNNGPLRKLKRWFRKSILGY